MRDFSQDHRWLSINTATVRAQWALDRIIEECAARGIRAVSPWRDQVAAVGIERVACRAGPSTRTSPPPAVTCATASPPRSTMRAR